MKQPECQFEWSSKEVSVESVNKSRLEAGLWQTDEPEGGEGERHSHIRHQQQECRLYSNGDASRTSSSCEHRWNSIAPSPCAKPPVNTSQTTLNPSDLNSQISSPRSSVLVANDIIPSICVIPCETLAQHASVGSNAYVDGAVGNASKANVPDTALADQPFNHAILSVAFANLVPLPLASSSDSITLSINPQDEMDYQYPHISDSPTSANFPSLHPPLAVDTNGLVWIRARQYVIWERYANYRRPEVQRYVHWKAQPILQEHSRAFVHSVLRRGCWCHYWVFGVPSM
ncbi:hypothetical protein BC829DRAFT_384816, partial [Chytridium lagenaria]